MRNAGLYEREMQMNENRAGLGYQDFEEIRIGNIFYIDKTDFIRQWWEYADKVTLITARADLERR